VHRERDPYLVTRECPEESSYSDAPEDRRIRSTYMRTRWAVLAAWLPWIIGVQIWIDRKCPSAARARQEPTERCPATWARDVR